MEEKIEMEKKSGEVEKEIKILKKVDDIKDGFEIRNKKIKSLKKNVGLMRSKKRCRIIENDEVGLMEEKE